MTTIDHHDNHNCIHSPAVMDTLVCVCVDMHDCQGHYFSLINTSTSLQAVPSLLELARTDRQTGS